MSGSQHAKIDSSGSVKPNEAAPQRMVQELSAFQKLTNELIQTIYKSSVPLGYRHSSGEQIQSLIRQILESSRKVKAVELDVYKHQERQQKVTHQIETVQNAESRIDELVKELQGIEAELSLVLHRAKFLSSTVPGGGARTQSNELNVEDVINYSCHCSFTTSCGIRWFFPDGRPMHPPDQRDPRFLFPYPAAHGMRLQGEGGMWDHRSSRKPQPLEEAPASQESEADAAMEQDAASRDDVMAAPLAANKRPVSESGAEGDMDLVNNKRARNDSTAVPNGLETEEAVNAPAKDLYGPESEGMGMMGEEADEMQQEEEEEEEEDDDEFAMDLNPSYPAASQKEQEEEEEKQELEQQQSGAAFETEETAVPVGENDGFEDDDDGAVGGSAAAGASAEESAAADEASAGADEASAGATEETGAAAPPAEGTESGPGEKEGFSSDEGFSSGGD